MTVYPYRTPGGSRSILDAIDLDDALKWTRECGYAGTVLCELEIEPDALFAIPPTELAGLVDRLIAEGPSYVA